MCSINARVRDSHTWAPRCARHVLHTPETLQERRRVKEEDGGNRREKETAVKIEREGARKAEREREERFTQTLAKLRPSLTSGYIVRVNELAPADDQGL